MINLQMTSFFDYKGEYDYTINFDHNLKPVKNQCDRSEQVSTQIKRKNTAEEFKK